MLLLAVVRRCQGRKPAVRGHPLRHRVLLPPFVAGFGPGPYPDGRCLPQGRRPGPLLLADTLASPVHYKILCVCAWLLLTSIYLQGVFYTGCAQYVGEAIYNLEAPKRPSPCGWELFGFCHTYVRDSFHHDLRRLGYLGRHPRPTPPYHSTTTISPDRARRKKVYIYRQRRRVPH